MSEGNPYDPSSVPPGGPGAPGAPNSAGAASKVSGPAIALIVVGAINALIGLYGVVNNVVFMARGPGEIEAQLDPQARKQLEELEAQGFDPQTLTRFMQAGGIVGIVMNIIMLGVAAVIIMGALKMKNLQSRGMAMTASILAMIPCISCCIIGLPIGIWSLVVLNDPNVRDSFLS